MMLAAVAAKAIGRRYDHYALNPSQRGVVDAMTAAKCRANCMPAVRAGGVVPFHAVVLNRSVMMEGAKIADEVLRRLCDRQVDFAAVLAAAGELIMAYSSAKKVPPSATLEAMPQILEHIKGLIGKASS